MSSRHLLVITALTSFFVVSDPIRTDAGKAAAQAPSPSLSLADLVVQDQISQLETRLANGTRTAETVAYQGELAYRRGRFDEAERLYRTSLEMSDKTARAHFGLGKLALARMKTEEATKLFARAISLDSSEPLYRFYISDAMAQQKKSKEAENHLREYLKLNPNDPDRVPVAKAAIDVMAAFGDVEIGEVVAPPQLAPIPLQKLPVLDLLFANVSINGEGPFRFLVDTGATQTVLSEKLAQRLGLKKIASNVMHGVGGAGKVESGIYRVDALKIGDVTVKNLPLGTTANPMLDAIMDGIVGTSMLSEFTITIDYPQKKIELSRSSPQGGTVVPVWQFSGLLLIPLDIDGRHKGNFLIDTGADSTVLAHSMANALGINKDTPGASVNAPIGGIGGVDSAVLLVRDVVIKNPLETKQYPLLPALDFKSMSSVIQTELSGVLGYDTLKDYRITLDYSKAEIRLSK